MGLLTITRIDTDSRLNPKNRTGQDSVPPVSSGCIENLELTLPAVFNPDQTISVNTPFESACNYSNQSTKWYVTLDTAAAENNPQSPDSLGGGSFSPVLDPRTSGSSSTGKDYLDYDGSLEAYSPSTEIGNYLDSHVLKWKSSANPMVFSRSFRELALDDSSDAGEDIPTYPGGYTSPDLDFSINLFPLPPYNPSGSISTVITGDVSSQTFKWYIKTDSAAAENNPQSGDAIGGGTNFPGLNPRDAVGNSVVMEDGAAGTYIPRNGSLQLVRRDDTSSSINNWESTHNRYSARFGLNASSDGSVSQTFATSYVTIT